MTATDVRPRLAEALASGAELVGVVTKLVAPALVEMCGHAGVDLVVLDTEHGPADTAELEHHLRAADSAGVPALVRVGSGDHREIQHALDAGAAGVVVPHVSDAAAAQRAVAAAHYPPLGRRGLALTTRAGHQSTIATVEALQARARDTVVVVQIEDPAGVDAAASIAATDRVSAIWVGTNDLALELGVPGQLTHPAVQRSLGRVGDAIGSVDGPHRPALMGIPADDRDAERWRAVGASVLLYTIHGLLLPRLREVVAARRQ